MKLCNECRRTPWPFVFALFISWLMLSFSGFGELEQLIGTGMMFFAAAATLMHYVLSCMKRHCRHGGHHHHHPANG
jgi:hypothetical protein